MNFYFALKTSEHLNVAFIKKSLTFTPPELTALNQVVGMYLAFAERQAQKEIPMKMADWIAKLDSFLEFNDENILTHAGKISHQMALEHAGKEFEKYEINCRTIEANQAVSDFDKLLKQLPTITKKNKS